MHVFKRRNSFVQKLMVKFLLIILTASNLLAIEPLEFISRTELFENARNYEGKLIPQKEVRDQMKFDIDSGSYKLKDNSYKLNIDKYKGGNNQYSRITEWHLTPRSWYSKFTDYKEKIIIGMTSLFDTEGNLIIRTECNVFEGGLYSTSRGCGSATAKRCEMAQALKNKINKIEAFHKNCTNTFKDIENFVNDKTDIELIKNSYDHLNTDQDLPGKIKRTIEDNGRRGTLLDTLDVNIKMLKGTIDLCDKYSKFFKEEPIQSQVDKKEATIVKPN